MDKAPQRKTLQGHDPASGADRDRTGDPLLAKQVLSQLSYRPEGIRAYKLAASVARPKRAVKSCVHGRTRERR